MTWTKLTDDFLEDEAVVALSDRGYRLYVSGLVYCSRNLTDGLLTSQSLRVLRAVLGYRRLPYYARELVAAGLWAQDGDGYRVRNYLKFHPSAEAVKEERQKARERMQRLRGSGERSGEQAPDVRANGNLFVPGEAR